MPSDLTLILALAIPTLLLFFLRANAALVFLSICLGNVLVEQVAGQASDLAGMITPKAGSVSQSTLSLTLLLVPAVITTIVTMVSVRGKLKATLNIVPAAAASTLAVLLAVPLLPRSVSFPILTQSLWVSLSKAEALVIGLGALVSLFFLWSQRRSFKGHDKRHH